MSALIEAFAPQLSDEQARAEPITECLGATVTTARAIDATRRRRRSP